MAEPAFNDLLDLIRPELDRRVELLRSAIRRIESEEFARGISENLVARVLDQSSEEFEAGALNAFRALKRVSQSTKLAPQNLFQLTVQSLENFALAIKAAANPEKLGRIVAPATINERLNGIDQRLAWMAKQYDVGLLHLGDSEPPARVAPSSAAASLPDASDRTAEPTFPLESHSGGQIETNASVKTSAGAPLSLSSDPPVVALSAASLEIGKATPSFAFRDNAERAETLARALSTTIKREIERLKAERPNEPERQAEIDFLEIVSTTLDAIASAIREARRATTPQDREQKFVEAETRASSLAKALRSFAERNYERVLDYGGYSVLTILGTQLFTALFGVPAEEALAVQLLLLGLPRKK